eukprot:EG_transcript_29897
MLQRHRDKLVAGAVVAAVLQAPALWRLGSQAAHAVHDYFFRYTPTEGDLYIDPLDLLGLPVEAANLLKEERGMAAFFREFITTGTWRIDPQRGLCKADPGRAEGAEGLDSRADLWEDLVNREDEEEEEEPVEGGVGGSSVSGSPAHPFVVGKPATTRGQYRI